MVLVSCKKEEEVKEAEKVTTETIEKQTVIIRDTVEVAKPEEKKPEPVPYPAGGIKYMHYGKVVEKFIQRAMQIEDQEKRMVMAELTANLMKKDYLAWNRDAVTDETIFGHLEEMSKGVLKFEESKKLNFIDFRTKNTTNGNNHTSVNVNREQNSNGGKKFVKPGNNQQRNKKRF